MLVVTRKVGERIQIGEDITLTVVRINGPAVRLGINAPEDLAVVRQELVQNSTARHPTNDLAKETAAS
jgi:carbon storage regulator